MGFLEFLKLEKTEQNDSQWSGRKNRQAYGKLYLGLIHVSCAMSHLSSSQRVQLQL